ncbi:hypothetical protein GCM10007052_25660 [Halioglobus japonicus]|uniref:Peptidase M23 n=1 Tax=Halioglobus japonicus TaxID=930805 RepID=A0AAP8MBT1_9GAMM|nr:peptidoglycan DD-metalloendopeptidase family protein [Halioglobus japonicus]PLW84895.1 peptidase M23 [Halioglobus japonicus]GHD18380.1 hypothetical protein GCM10007052_25660 [Halioglobus japonicus]
MSGAKRPRGATAIREPKAPLSRWALPTVKVKRNHLTLGLAVAGCLAIGLGLSGNDESAPESQDVATLEPVTPPEIASPEVAPAPPAPALPAEAPWVEDTVRSGDNLSLIFERAGYTKRDVHRVVTEPEHGKGLARIHPGQTIAFQAGNNGELAGVKHVKSRLETVLYRLDGDTYTSEILEREPEVVRSTASGVITSSLFMAGQEAGLSQTTIMEMANIFGGVIDFVGDPRKGDTMNLVFEEHLLDGTKFDDGDIIAASYNNQGKMFTAYRYVDVHGETGYYNADGVSMRKAFLLAPVDFTRISSNFNPARIHPIYKTARPHRGTDYAAPTGTPVYAAGDGRVVKAGYSKANGNYVFIQHGEQFETKYLHLHKRHAKKGQRVSQGQVIGTVGMTGAATGPHLHYEFLMNGVHRNPRTIHKKLPKAKSLPTDELPRFKAAIEPIAQQLAQLQTATDTQLALAAAEADDRG